MNIGDRVHIALGASSVVVIREIHDNGLVTVENETAGTGVYLYVTKPDHFIPATTEPLPSTAEGETGSVGPAPDIEGASYLDELNNT
jgi:hypothetical protein